jgi:hypothetical protein
VTFTFLFVLLTECSDHYARKGEVSARSAIAERATVSSVDSLRDRLPSQSGPIEPSRPGDPGAVTACRTNLGDASAHQRRAQWRRSARRPATGPAAGERGDPRQQHIGRRAANSGRARGRGPPADPALSGLVEHPAGAMKRRGEKQADAE